jgi:PIN domain nuclease of toxin-antitoxin system
LIVLDTHVWIWWVVAPKRLSRVASRAIEQADRVGVSTMSLFEVGELAQRQRITLDAPLRTWVRAALARERVDALPVTIEVALDAAQLRFTADPVDRIIYATARAEDAQLVTRDERLRAFDPERAIW